MILKQVSICQRPSLTLRISDGSSSRISVHTAYRYSNVHPELKFDGTTAYCTASVTGNSMKDEIDIVVKLWKGNGCIATWKESGVGYVFLSKNKTVEKNYEYTLTIDAKVNGKTRPTASVTAKCK